MASKASCLSYSMSDTPSIVTFEQPHTLRSCTAIREESGKGVVRSGLIDYERVEEPTARLPLTARGGQTARGELLYIRSTVSKCLACGAFPTDYCMAQSNIGAYCCASPMSLSGLRGTSVVPEKTPDRNDKACGGISTTRSRPL